jgi:hypothetical protein
MIRRLMILALALILLFGALPLLAAFSAFAIAGSLGCRLNEGSIHPCLFLGRDVGDMLYTMLVSGWFGMLTIPLAGTALVIWLVIALALALLRWRRRRVA